MEERKNDPLGKFMDVVEKEGSALSCGLFKIIGVAREFFDGKIPPIVVDNVILQSLFRTLAVHISYMIDRSHKKEIPDRKKVAIIGEIEMAIGKVMGDLFLKHGPSGSKTLIFEKKEDGDHGKR